MLCAANHLDQAGKQDANGVTEEDLMVNLLPNRTGLSFGVYVSPAPPTCPHGPRVKVSCVLDGRYHPGMLLKSFLNIGTLLSLSLSPLLPVTLFVWPAEVNAACLQMTIEEEPRHVAGPLGNLKRRHIREATEWIKLNMDALLKYWNYEYDIVDFLSNLQQL